MGCSWDPRESRDPPSRATPLQESRDSNPPPLWEDQHWHRGQSLGTHLDLQLLYHLHLHPALGRAPVIQGVLRVEVSSGKRNVAFLPGPCLGPASSPKPPPSPHWRGKEGSEVGTRGAVEGLPVPPPRLDVFAKIPATERSNCK